MKSNVNKLMITIWCFCMGSMLFAADGIKDSGTFEKKQLRSIVMLGDDTVIYGKQLDTDHNGSTISDWTDEDYMSQLSREKANQWGTIVNIPETYRDSEHTFKACADGYASEGSWQVWSYVTSSYLFEVSSFTSNYGCQEYTATLPPGQYSFELYE